MVLFFLHTGFVPLWLAASSFYPCMCLEEIILSSVHVLGGDPGMSGMRKLKAESSTQALLCKVGEDTALYMCSSPTPPLI